MEAVFADFFLGPLYTFAQRFGFQFETVVVVAQGAELFQALFLFLLE